MVLETETLKRVSPNKTKPAAWTDTVELSVSLCLTQRHNVPGSRLYVSGPNPNTFRLNTFIHAPRQWAAVRMLNHSKQLKSL